MNESKIRQHAVLLHYQRKRYDRERGKHPEAFASSGVEYRVVKNTLIKKALTRCRTILHSTKAPKGFSGVMFHPESGKVPA